MKNLSSQSVLFLGGVGEVAGPQGQVVSEQLHDSGRVAVLVLLQTVEVGDGIVESSLGEFASVVGGVEDLVIEHGIVEGKSKSDGMCGLECLSLVACDLVCLLCELDNILALVPREELAEVAEVVALHLHEEDLGLGVLRVGDEGVIEEAEHIVANVLQLLLNLGAVALDQVDEAGALGELSI